jgi:hypothetical protein
MVLFSQMFDFGIFRHFRCIHSSTLGFYITKKLAYNLWKFFITNLISLYSSSLTWTTSKDQLNGFRDFECRDSNPPLVILHSEILSNCAKNLIKNFNIIAQVMSELYHTAVKLWDQAKINGSSKPCSSHSTTHTNHNIIY